MIRQFTNISTWRKYDITIEPHVVHTVNFIDTLPNIFVINNPNVATLKVGISAIPRTDSYEFKVEYNTTETMGRPIGTGALYILNDSSVPVKITLFSIEKDFDPALLKNMNVALSGYTIETDSIISGFREGLVLPIQVNSDVANDIKSILELVRNSDETDTAIDLDNIVSKLDNIADNLNLLNNKLFVSNTTESKYFSEEFIYTTERACTFNIEWICSNGEGHIYVGNDELLPLHQGEIIKDIAIHLEPEQFITINGDAGVKVSFNYAIIPR